MTPLMIEIMLHYYYSAEDFSDGDFSAPAVRDGINWLRDDAKLIEFVPDDERKSGVFSRGYVSAAYRLTERGRVYVEAIKKVPLPVQVWVTPREDAA